MNKIEDVAIVVLRYNLIDLPIKKGHLKVGNLIFNTEGFTRFDKYTKELTHPTDSAYDIMEVYSIKNERELVTLGGLLNVNEYYHKLEWRR